MLYKRDIEEEINQVNSLKSLAEVYGEIASIRMKRIRGVVLSTRKFLDAINDIFKDTLASYAKKLSDMVRAGKLKRGSKVTFLAHNGKTVVVLLSANTGFFGEIVPKVFAKFIHEVRTEDVEVTIVGKLGKSMFLDAEPKRPFTYFELPDYGIDRRKMAEIIKHLVAYEEIRVYYGKFQSVVTQEPTAFRISAGTPVGEYVVAPKEQYIFEPSVDKILMFFETQIFASLFDQSIRESQLAKFASRILAMDRAADNINKRIRKLNLDKLKVQHKVDNNEQLNSLMPVYYRTVSS
jgi:ATP synthase F1 gamma subunit